jgi:uncharacterized lipoprotein YmbA
MRRIRTFLCAVLTLTIGACANSPPVQYFSLDDGRLSAVRSADGLCIAVTQVNLPELVDRPQLIVRTPGHQLQINDQYEWAEPLRRQIPRAIARGLGEELNSACVIVLPMDAQDYDMDFKVALNIQRLEVVSGQGVELDAVWRAQSRNGKVFVVRSFVWEHLAAATGRDGEYAAAVAAQSGAVRGLASAIAAGIARWQVETTSGEFSKDRSAGPILPHVRREWRDDHI